MGASLDQVAAELYGLPLEEFVARRNARAKELKGSDPDLAAQVARLPKPLAAAHRLNAFAREHADALDRLLDLGADLREAQETRDGEQVRALTKQAAEAIRDALGALGGSDPLPLEQTLRAAMADERAAEALRAGLLVRPLSTAGFGEVDLTGAVAVETPAALPRTRTKTAAPTDRRTGQERAARAAEEAATRRAAERLARAEAELAGAEDALASAADAHQAARARVAEAEAVLDAARDEERAAGRSERKVREERDRAERAVQILRRG